jgi:hypothetical protein
MAPRTLILPRLFPAVSQSCPRIESEPVKSRLLQPMARLATAAISVVGVCGIALTAMGSPASAITPAPVCGATTCSVTFSTAGTGQTWVVPAGVTSESITLYGAIGGSTNIVLGGDGAKVSGTLALSPGTSVTVDVGGAGTDGASPGINGGGASELGTGGGGSDVKVAGVDLLAAGGGGGAGNPEGENAGTVCSVSGTALGGAGGNADTAGVAGTAIVVTISETAVTLNPGDGGGAGTMSGGAGGAGGTASAPADCNGATVNGSAGGTGSSNQGGAGGVTGVDGLLGGGGGGGYFGGGGGGGASTDPAGNFPGYSGGGGGSSFPATDLISDTANVASIGNVGSVNGGNGQVTISYAIAAGTSPGTTTGTGASTTPTAPTTTSRTTTTPSALAVTGANLTALLIGGGSLIVGGVLVLGAISVANRRRRSPS